jgi:hypothetical protein
MTARLDVPALLVEDGTLGVIGQIFTERVERVRTVVLPEAGRGGPAPAIEPAATLPPLVAPVGLARGLAVPHREVARALARSLSYAGSDRRLGDRVLVGSSISYEVGGERVSALLLDLSPNGCGLLVEYPVPPGRPMAITIRASRSDVVRITGTVIRLADHPGSELEDWYQVGVRFRALDERQALAIQHVLARRRGGRDPAAQGGGSSPAGAPPQPDPFAERRRFPRVEVEDVWADALCVGATRALMIRDLSEEAMRAAPDVRLALGDRVRVVLQPHSLSDALLIEGRVEQDDHARGLLIRFLWMDPGARERLRALVRERGRPLADRRRR